MNLYLYMYLGKPKVIGSMGGGLDSDDVSFSLVIYHHVSYCDVFYCMVDCETFIPFFQNFTSFSPKYRNIYQAKRETQKQLIRKMYPTSEANEVRNDMSGNFLFLYIQEDSDGLSSGSEVGVEDELLDEDDDDEDDIKGTSPLNDSDDNF